MKKHKMEKPEGPRTMRGIRMNDNEWQQIRKAAKLLKMTASEFIRCAALVQARYTKKVKG